MTSHEKARARFRSETSKHTMTVLHDVGLYRHLRFQERGTSIYLYDLVTWPGFLTITGDVQTHVFSRVKDMFTFFTGPGINPDYWGQKLQQPRGRDSVRLFSEARYRERVQQWLSEYDVGEGDSPILLRDAVHEQLLDGEAPHDEREAIERLRDFSHNGLQIYEPYEWDLTVWDPHFLWCCWAIVEGVKQYDAHVAKVRLRNG